MGMDMLRSVCSGILVFLMAGCAAQSPWDRSYVSEGVRERTNYELGPETEPGCFTIPDGVSLEDGLSLDEAVGLALWNNAQLQVDLAALGFARADLIEANMLANPVFSLLFPVGPKLLETRLTYPINILWERPRRIAAAKRDAEALAERLIEHGLGLIRDVEQAYVDLWLAQEQARLADEGVGLQAEQVQIEQRRLEAGDISELEASAAQADSLHAIENARKASQDVAIFCYRLHLLLGQPSEAPVVTILSSAIGVQPAAPIDALLDRAMAARPDLRAAELKIEAAGERLGWEQSKILNFILWLDGKDKGEKTLEIGPGFAVDVPIFSQNDGRVARAKAELETAARDYEAIRQRVVLQVQEAHAEYVLAREQCDFWRTDVVPVLERANQQAEKSYDAGEISYVGVLATKKKLVEAQLHQAELMAGLHRSVAQLNYCVGQRII